MQVYEIVGVEEVRAAGEVYELQIGKIEDKEMILSTCSPRSELRGL